MNKYSAIIANLTCKSLPYSSPAVIVTYGGGDTLSVGYTIHNVQCTIYTMQNQYRYRLYCITIRAISSSYVLEMT